MPIPLTNATWSVSTRRWLVKARSPIGWRRARTNCTLGRLHGPVCPALQSKLSWTPSVQCGTRATPIKLWNFFVKNNPWMQCEKLISGGNKIAAAQRSHSKNWHLNRPSSSRAAQFKQAKHVSSQVHFQTGVYRPQLYWGCKECFKDRRVH